jgi:hypothetical protein
VTLDEAVAASRAAFPDPTPVGHIPLILGVPDGDVLRILRSHAEGGPLDVPELVRELANGALTRLRLVAELGVDVDQALAAAAESHARYAARLRPDAAVG